jgi:hypothetical protein
MAVMLKKSELTELAIWTNGYQLSDFLFLFGARRIGSKIQLNHAEY